MQFFTGWQYLLIEAATQYGLDKLTFDARIEWATTHLQNLEAKADEQGDWKEKPLYLKAVQAIRKAQQGLPMGHLVGMDGVCSGIQIMSVLTGCREGGMNTGLIDTGERPDAYNACTVAMNTLLNQQGLQVNVSRKDAKYALMTSFYGSKRRPADIFGEDTPELTAFYQAAQQVAPGAWELLHTLLAAWQPWAKFHAWQLPDGYDARVKVMQRKDLRIAVDELDGASFSYVYYENQGSKTGISLPANMVHSVDAYVLRCVHRRCNYDPVMVKGAYEALLTERALRTTGICAEQMLADLECPLARCMLAYARTGLADVVILPLVQQGSSTQYLEDAHIDGLIQTIEGMLQYQPFDVVTIHDEFKCHPNHMNWLRWQYKEILAEIADSRLLDDLLSQIHGQPVHFQKHSNYLGKDIRQANYTLC